MKPEEVRVITDERLDSWGRLLVSEHATPIVLLGVGHDHKSGNLVVCVPDEVSREDVIHFLKGALRLLRGR